MNEHHSQSWTHGALLLASGLLVAAVGCSPGSKVASIDISGDDPIAFFVKKSQALPKVTLKDKSGEVLSDIPVTWTASPAGVVKIIGGKVIPQKNGSAVLTPKVEGSTVVARLGALVSFVDSLKLNCIPRSCEGQPGDRIKITVDPQSEGNTVVGVKVNLESEDVNVAKKESDNDFRLTAAGQTNIKATLGEVRKRQLIRVRQPPPDELRVMCPKPKATWKALRNKKSKAPRTACRVKVGQTVDLKAMVMSMGKEVPLRQPDWSVGNSTIVKVDGGLVTGLKAGTEVVRVSIEGLLITVPLEVRKR